MTYDEFEDDSFTCVDAYGNDYPEHNWTEWECKRCGAEAVE